MYTIVLDFFEYMVPNWGLCGPIYEVQRFLYVDWKMMDLDGLGFKENPVPSWAVDHVC